MLGKLSKKMGWTFWSRWLLQISLQESPSSWFLSIPGPPRCGTPLVGPTWPSPLPTNQAGALEELLVEKRPCAERRESVKPCPVSRGKALKTQCKLQPVWWAIIADSSVSTLDTLEALNLPFLSHPGLCWGCLLCSELSLSPFPGCLLSGPPHRNLDHLSSLPLGQGPPVCPHACTDKPLPLSTTNSVRLMTSTCSLIYQTAAQGLPRIVKWSRPVLSDSLRPHGL